jgi:hypothetical protein
MGLNVQAMCDLNLKFLYMAILAPGNSSDIKAYEASALQSWIESLPPWVFVVADNAYVCSERLLTPFLVLNEMNQPMTHITFTCHSCEYELKWHLDC